ncbi:MAG: dinitrogenase iron-molybdenum cofactor biosynthesis protein [Armatimonadetes bacterium]|nr:dinitrogenase iron-molybdenum cofactor biosynthesis protein [Armatimonadota bacterium]
MKLLVAFGTDDGENLTDTHFGQSAHFDLYEVTPEGSTFVERRENAKYEEDESLLHGDPGKARSVMSVLGGVQAAVGKRFGPNLTRMIKKIACVVVRVDTVAEALKLVEANLETVVAEYEKGEARRHVVLKPED